MSGPNPKSNKDFRCAFPTGLPDINAGAWYLRARLDGSWDVCEPVTGEPLAEVTADPDSGEVTARGDAHAAAAGAEAVRRFLRQLVAQPGQ